MLDLDTEKQIIDCYVNDGLSVASLAAQFGVGYGRITHCLRKHLGELKQRPYIPNADRGLKSLYSSYTQNATARNYPFELSLEQFKEITQQNCHYCGVEPYQHVWDFTYNGIDRIDNAHGYTLDNVRPCCGICNYAKGKSTEQEFFAWIDRLVTYRMSLQVVWCAQGRKCVAA